MNDTEKRADLDEALAEIKGTHGWAWEIIAGALGDDGPAINNGRDVADMDHEAITESVFAALDASSDIEVTTASGYEPNGDILVRSAMRGYAIKVVPI